MNGCAKCGQEVELRRMTWWHKSDGSQACVIDGVQHVNAGPAEGVVHCDIFHVTDGVTWKMTTAQVNADMIAYDDTTFEVAGSNTSKFDEWWAACEDCKRLLDEARAVGDTTALVQLADKTIGSFRDAPGSDDLRSALIELHTMVIANFQSWERIG